ncbi:MAG: hypothetical protein IT464_00620 [Planctomycetes bacterium]|nr:hypothetical protein [Planctomycetota bacterium]
MYRTFHLLLLCGVLVAVGCSGDGDERQKKRDADRAAAIDEFRPRLRAQLDAMYACASAAQAAAKEGKPAPLALGERAAPVLVTGWDKDAKGNGMLLGLPESGDFHQDNRERLVDGLGSTKIFDEIERALAGDANESATELKELFATLLSFRYVCVVVQDAYEPGVVTFASGGEYGAVASFRSGSFQGRWFLFEIAGGALLGGGALDVRNSKDVKFSTSKGDGKDTAYQKKVREDAQNQLFWDMRAVVQRTVIEAVK